MLHELVRYMKSMNMHGEKIKVKQMLYEKIKIMYLMQCEVMYSGKQVTIF